MSDNIKIFPVTIHAFPKHSDALKAFRESKVPGRRIAPAMKIDGPKGIHIYRRVADRHDCNMLAGVTFNEIKDHGIPAECKLQLLGRLRS